MQGLKPFQIVATALPALTLPSLTRPAVKPKEPPTEELVKWGICFYVYSVIAHLRIVLSGLLQVAEANNLPAAYVLCRHVFEWTAHACYMARNLNNYVGRKEWNRGWSLLSIAATGNLWAKRHGPKYYPARFRDSLPDPLSIANIIAAYDQYLRQQHRNGDGKDDYGLLSEHSHPNAACFQHCNEYIGAEVRFKAASSPSPLPVVNWCLIDLLMFLDSLLLLANERTVRTQLRTTLEEMAQLVPQQRGDRRQ